MYGLTEIELYTSYTSSESPLISPGYSYMYHSNAFQMPRY